VRAERRGAFIYYCLTDPELLHILRDLKHWLDARQVAVTGRSRRPSKRSASVAART